MIGGVEQSGEMRGMRRAGFEDVEGAGGGRRVSRLSRRRHGPLSPARLWAPRDLTRSPRQGACGGAGRAKGGGEKKKSREKDSLFLLSFSHLRAQPRQVEVVLDVVIVDGGEVLVAAEGREPGDPGGGLAVNENGWRMERGGAG